MATSLPQFAKSVVKCSTAPGLDKAAALSTYNDGAFIEVMWTSGFCAGRCRGTARSAERRDGYWRLQHWQTVDATRHCSPRCQLNSWSLLINNGRWPVITGISPAVDVLQVDDVRLPATACSEQLVWLPARVPHRCRPSWVIFRHWSWLSSVALTRNGNIWSREYVVGIWTVINSVWMATNIMQKRHHCIHMSTVL